MKAIIQHKDNLNQKFVLQALVPFVSLKDSVLFTYRANVTQQTEDKYAQFKSSMDYYQRRVDSKRSDEIKNFVRNSIIQEMNGKQMATLFPTSMILAISTDEDLEPANRLAIGEDDNCDLCIETNVFIVDGQHRMMGMIKLYEDLDKQVVRTEEDDYVYEFLKKYKFNCSILVNYDLWEQGQVFVNVNFKQKPVNKSLYYEVFGSEYHEEISSEKQNKIFLAHEMAYMLNENKESPYYGCVKMLGTGQGYISQAFIVESLQRNFKDGGLWYFDPDKSEAADYYGTELLSYFVAINKIFKRYWPEAGKKEGTIICKTTGFGAWIRLMGMLRRDDDLKLLSNLRDSAKKGEICVPYIDHVAEKLSPLKKYASTLFGENSEFKSSSGQGSETKLYKKMLYYLQNPNSVDVKGKKLGFDVESLRENIQEYVWSNPIDDLDPLGYRCEVEEIDDFEIVEYGGSDSGFDIKAAFNIYVNIFMDNEDEVGFSMQFPSHCTVSLNRNSQGFEIDENSVRISVDTDKYYK